MQKAIKLLVERSPSWPVLAHQCSAGARATPTKHHREEREHAWRGEELQLSSLHGAHCSLQWHSFNYSVHMQKIILLLLLTYWHMRLICEYVHMSLLQYLAFTSKKGLLSDIMRSKALWSQWKLVIFFLFKVVNKQNVMK